VYKKRPTHSQEVDHVWAEEFPIVFSGGKELS
jgi:hypothetical protein